jgi:hypothetical protein
MGFFGFMTGEAVGIGLLKFRIQVAGFTSGDTMHPDQWKTGDIMLKEEFYIPSQFIVTITAILTQFIFMYIDRPMTGDTFSLLQIVHRHGAVTGVTDQILVFAFEGKFSICSMIELHLGPTLRLMTILTLFPIAAFVHIIFFMT